MTRRPWRIPVTAWALALAAVPIPAGSQELAAPEGFEIQSLKPIGGKLAKPKGWHYIERHGGAKYSWVVSREPVDKNPVITGIRLQLFLDVKKGAGKTAEEFCKGILEECVKRGRNPVVIPEMQSGIFRRAGVEMIEGLEVDGKTTDNHVYYFAFWHPGSDTAAIMSVGCPVDDWQEMAPTLKVMAQLQLIDEKKFVKEGKIVGLTAPKDTLPSRSQVLGAISRILSDPLDASAPSHVNVVNRFAGLSQDVQVEIKGEFFPWMNDKMQAGEKDGPLLFGAYIAGNLRPQLEKKVNQNHPLEGIQAVLKTYALLREADRFPAVPQYDEWLKLDEEGLKTVITDH